MTTTASTKVTLSFDNGPTPGVTEKVLDTLADHGMRAVFFPTAQNLRNPSARALAERAVSEGHRFGNHSLTHGAPLGELSDTEGVGEIVLAQQLLGELADPARWLRPWGTIGVQDQRCLSQAAVEYLISGGYTCVLWNSVPGDWADTTGWVDTAMGHVSSQEHTLVVLHDIATGAMDALPRFLDRLQEAEVTVTQELPPSCLPIVNGQVVAPIDHLVNAG